MSESGTIIITGVAGFLGSHLAEALLARGRRVVGIDNFDPFYAASLKRANLSGCRGAFELIEADIADAGAMRTAFERTRPEGVIHLAAKAGVRPSIADPAGYARANVLGTSVLLDAAHAARCARFVMASSSSVYGNNTKVPFGEDDDVSRPISPYAATKRACELLAHTHWSLTRMPTACLRFFTVYGERQRPDLAIASFLRRVASGEPIEVFGDGSTSRDYTYVADIIAGVLSAYERIDRHGYRVWNLGSDRPVRLDEMVRVVGRVAGREPVIARRPVPPGDVDRTWADLTRAAAELGYKAKTPFEEGVSRQWDWFTKQPSRA